MNAIKHWFAERLPIFGVQLQELTNEPVPSHLRHWWFCLGGTPAYLFVVQIVTGVLLAFYYQPSPHTAFHSINAITNDVAFGWYIRGMHKWAATLMIAAVVLHEVDPASSRDHEARRRIGQDRRSRRRQCGDRRDPLAARTQMAGERQGACGENCQREVIEFEKEGHLTKKVLMPNCACEKQWANMRQSPHTHRRIPECFADSLPCLL